MFRFRGLRKRVGGDDRGAALVEFAFIIPLFMMLVVGMISSGIAYNQKMQLTHAAREGARYGAAVPAGQTFTSGTWADNVRKLVMERSGGELKAADQVCVALVREVTPVAISPGHSTEPGAAPCFDDSNGGEKNARVQVAVERPGSFDAVFVKFELNLTSRAGARHEGGG